MEKTNHSFTKSQSNSQSQNHNHKIRKAHKILLLHSSVTHQSSVHHQFPTRRGGRRRRGRRIWLWNALTSPERLSPHRTAHMASTPRHCASATIYSSAHQGPLAHGPPGGVEREAAGEGREAAGGRGGEGRPEASWEWRGVGEWGLGGIGGKRKAETGRWRCPPRSSRVCRCGCVPMWSCGVVVCGCGLVDHQSTGTAQAQRLAHRARVSVDAAYALALCALRQ